MEYQLLISLVHEQLTQAEKEESPVSTPNTGLGAALFQALQNRANVIQGQWLLSLSCGIRSCCGSVDKTINSQSWGPRFESAGSGSTALGQGTLTSLHSPLERT